MKQTYTQNKWAYASQTLDCPLLSPSRPGVTAFRCFYLCHFWFMWRQKRTQVLPYARTGQKYHMVDDGARKVQEMGLKLYGSSWHKVWRLIVWNAIRNKWWRFGLCNNSSMCFHAWWVTMVFNQLVKANSAEQKISVVIMVTQYKETTHSDMRCRVDVRGRMNGEKCIDNAQVLIIKPA